MTPIVHSKNMFGPIEQPDIDQPPPISQVKEDENSTTSTKKLRKKNLKGVKCLPTLPEFPELGDSTTVKNRDIKLISRFKEEESRSQVFVEMSNNREIGKTLQKTKACWNVKKFGKCTRHECTFAHTLDEWIPPLCRFGDKCRHIEGGKHSLPCKFKHPSETLNEYFTRSGTTYPNLPQTTPKQQTPKQQTPKQQTPSIDIYNTLPDVSLPPCFRKAPTHNEKPMIFAYQNPPPANPNPDYRFIHNSSRRNYNPHFWRTYDNPTPTPPTSNSNIMQMPEVSTTYDRIVLDPTIKEETKHDDDKPILSYSDIEEATDEESDEESDSHEVEETTSDQIHIIRVPNEKIAAIALQAAFNNGKYNIKVVIEK